MTLLLSVALLAQSWCAEHRVTGYVRGEQSPWTADGTSIYTDEPIAAASVNIPLQSQVVVDDLGSYRVADRGQLGASGWVDIAVWTRREAYALTGWRIACARPSSD